MAVDAIRAAEESDWPAISGLLSSASLPLEGAEEIIREFLVAERGGEVVACAALEAHDGAALLRSVAVRADLRGSGIGRDLVSHLLDRFSGTVVLLTTTAANWFPRFGFREASRDQVPQSIAQSVEFRSACPSSAVVMIRQGEKR